MNVHRVPAASRTSPAREILEHAATILLDIGLSKQSLLDELRDILRHKPNPTRSYDPAAMRNVAGYTHVLTHWYSDPEYRDRRSPRLPAALPLNGAGRSVASLICRVFPRDQVQTTTDVLIALGAIRRQGRRYVPASPVVSFSSDPAVTHIHAYMVLLGHMRTIAHNLAAKRGDAQRLFEQAATNANVPVSALPTIHHHIHRVLENALRRLDTYFSRWETNSDSEPTALVGAAAFAFDESTIPRRAIQTRGLRRTRAIRGSRHRRAERTP